MAIKANTYFQNNQDLSNLCEKDDALEVVSLTNVNNFSYPRIPTGGGATWVKNFTFTTNIYDGGTSESHRVEFPRVGTKPTFNSRILYHGYASTLTISASSSVLDIGGTKWYPLNFYKNTLPTVLLIVLCGAGGAGAGSTNLYTGSGGGGSGGVGVSVISTTSGDLQITMGSGGSTSQVAEGGTAGNGGSSLLKLAYSGTIMTATGGYGGGVRNGGGGGGNGGSATGGTYNYYGVAGGKGSGSESYGGSVGSTWSYSLHPYDSSVYNKSFSHNGGGAGSGGRSGGGGGGSVFAVGGTGSAKSSTAGSGNQGSGGGGGGCKNGIFGAASTGGKGGNGYVYIYGGYAP